MSDLISRQAAIDALNGEIEIAGRTNAEAVKGYVRLVKDRLERLPSAQPTIECDWIPCKKPPTENNAYLVTVHPDYIVPGGGQVDILVWVDDGWFFVDYGGKIARFPDPVIAWRPLPAPYKEDHNEP